MLAVAADDTVAPEHVGTPAATVPYAAPPPTPAHDGSAPPPAASSPAASVAPAASAARTADAAAPAVPQVVPAAAAAPGTPGPSTFRTGLRDAAPLVSPDAAKPLGDAPVAATPDTSGEPVGGAAAGAVNAAPVGDVAALLAPDPPLVTDWAVDAPPAIDIVVSVPDARSAQVEAAADGEAATPYASPWPAVTPLLTGPDAAWYAAPAPSGTAAVVPDADRAGASTRAAAPDPEVEPAKPAPAAPPAPTGAGSASASGAGGSAPPVFGVLCVLLLAASPVLVRWLRAASALGGPAPFRGLCEQPG